jgi:hypothetical protein
MPNLATSVAVGQSCNVAPCARRLMASFCCAGAWKGVGLLGCPRALARLLPSAVRESQLIQPAFERSTTQRPSQR